jgi:GTPase SAR1 family protein
MSEIKADYLDIFPEWITEIIRKEKLTIDIPTKLDLVSSRTELADIKDLEMLKPYIFNIVIKYIVSLALD